MPITIPSDAPSIYEVLKTLSALDRQAIVRPDNPPPGVAGYVFDILGDENTELVSDISRHFVEDNTTIQDQWALNPERITLHGIVAELVFTVPTPAQQASVPNPMPDNPAMVPEFTPGTDQVLLQETETVDANDRGVTSNQSLFAMYESKTQPNQTKQSRIFNYFYQLWKGRQLCTVETPYGVWTDMAIASVRSEQTEDSRSKSDFTIVFEKIRTAQPVVVNVGQLAGRALSQRDPVTQNGNAGTKPLSTSEEGSLLYNLMHPSP